MEERRQNIRLSCSLKVRCRLDQDGANTFDATGMNISDRGMLMRPSGGLREGQLIRIRFTLPDGSEIRNARAMVNRVEPQDCVAVHFISVNPNVQEAFA
jgi:c-di-GMP-binding flagellar brake protein YcgR